MRARIPPPSVTPWLVLDIVTVLFVSSLAPFAGEAGGFLRTPGQPKTGSLLIQAEVKRLCCSTLARSGKLIE